MSPAKKTKTVAQSPVVKAAAAIVLAVVAVAAVFDIKLDVEDVATFTPIIASALAYIYSRVRPVPKSDRGFRAAEDNASHLDRLIAEQDAEVDHG